MPEEIKKAFQKVKEDIFYLGSEVSLLKLELHELKNSIKILSENLNFYSNRQTHTPTDVKITPTIPTHIPTHIETPTDNYHLYALKSQNIQVSTGNDGVPTDRQTNQQTDRHIINTNFNNNNTPNEQENNKLQKADEILENLDSLKKELRLKIKRLTPQEMSIFSLIYSLEEAGEIVDYKILSSKTNLSESSIRDYTLKITKKGLPLSKEKLNNKRVVLHISQNLKKLASLETIQRLREL